MRISFYLKEGDDETQITSFNELTSNPFKVGDIINLKVERLHLMKIVGFMESFREKVTENNDKLSGSFNNKKVKLIEESKWVSFDVVSEPKMVIEYYCEILND